MTGRSWLSLFAVLATIACAEKKEAYEISPKDTIPSDAGTPTSSDDTDSETDTGLPPERGSDTDAPVLPGELGDPCWVEVLPSGHPNLGLEDCEPAFQCIGNKVGAWCSTPCPTVGITSEKPETEGWCCGDWGGSACDASLYWLPEPLAGNHCAPFDIPPGQPCEAGGESRCAPSCIGSEEAYRVVCATTDESSGFCTHACETHADCVDDVPFSNGCCGEIMGSTYCLPEVSDACLPI